MDILVIKLMSLAIHAEEFIETGHPADADAVKGLLADHDIKSKREELASMALLPVKRSD